jgi:hypothetical protein
MPRPVSCRERCTTPRASNQKAVCISSLALRRSGVINRCRLSYRIELVNTLEGAELERRVIDLLRRNELLNVKQNSQELEAHTAYLSGFLDGLVLNGKLELLSVGGSVKLYRLRSS